MNSKKRTLLIRIYGTNTNDIIDRVYELQVIKALEKQSLRPKLYGTFNNGYLFEYIEGEPLKHTDYSNPHISDLVATKAALWHQLTLPGNKKPLLWKRMDSWLQLSKEVELENHLPNFTWEMIEKEVTSPLKQNNAKIYQDRMVA